MVVILLVLLQLSEVQDPQTVVQAAVAHRLIVVHLPIIVRHLTAVHPVHILQEVVLQVVAVALVEVVPAVVQVQAVQVVVDKFYKTLYLLSSKNN